ncbi:MAG: hypothetical protein JXA30_09300 [Deltaproteobacteria bacterium]|nr:hypothetical protein [Deltaproteobacteria bacterium]
MGIASILLFAAAVLFMGIGVVTAWLPLVGFIFAFGSPTLALIGVILGGSAISQAKRVGRDSGTGLAGVILNTLAFFPALLVAFTCGVCNACVSSAVINPTNIDQWNISIKPEPTRQPLRKPHGPFDEPEQEPSEPDDPHSPPPILPEPPLDPGPSKKP